MDQPHFTIIGGGIAGLTTALALERSGMRATVYEAAPELRPVGAGLGLAANAVKAFDVLGLKHGLVQCGRRLHGLAILDEHGRTITATQGFRNPAMEQFAVHRADLQALLLKELAHTPVHLGKRVRSVAQDGSQVIVHFADGSVHHTEHLIIADGIHSASRASILPDVKPRYAGYTCWRGVVHAPDLRVGGATEAWGRKGRFGIVPLTGDRLYWFATVKSAEGNERYRTYRVRDLVAHFANYPGPINGILSRTTDDQLVWSDIHDLVPLARTAFGRVVLVGDAAHATTPNLGQGACQAIEDAVLLAQVLRGDRDVVKAFGQFHQLRRGRTKWVTETSWRLGRVAQWESPWAMRLRNGLLRMLPAAMNEAQLRRLADVRFDAFPKMARSTNENT